MSEVLRLLIALAPILVVLLLLVLRLPSLWAGVTGLAVAVAGAMVAYPLDGTGMAHVASDMAPTVLEVAVILLGGVTLAEAMARGGAQDRIAAWLHGEESKGDRTVTLLLLVYGMTPFMESVTGFGLGVVITAPLLIRLGLTPVRAVVTGLLGLVLVPWGSLAPGTLVAAQLGGQEFSELGVWSAILTLPVLVVSMIVVVALNIGVPSARELGLAAAVVFLAWGVLIGANLIIGPPLAGVLASAAVIAMLLALTRFTRGALPRVTRALVIALVPYLVLVGSLLLTSGLIAIVGDRMPNWVGSPGLWVVVAAAVAVATAALSTRERFGLARRALARWVPIAGNAVVFMLIGIVMAATGMASSLASFAAHAGPAFLVAVPAIGALGGYLTGSNTGAAAMFSAATTTAAVSLGGNPLIALAGQNVAGSFAIIASPPRIALAVGVALQQGERLPRTEVARLVGAVAAAAVLLGAAMAGSLMVWGSG